MWSILSESKATMTLVNIYIYIQRVLVELGAEYILVSLINGRKASI